MFCGGQLLHFDGKAFVNSLTVLTQGQATILTVPLSGSGEKAFEVGAYSFSSN